MNVTIRWCVALVFVHGVAFAQPPARDTRAAAGTGVIRGRVVDANDGRPLPLVAISVADLQNVGAVSGLDGRYEIANVPAGRHRVTAATEGYLTLGYGQTRPAQGGKTVEVTDRQVVNDIDFPLPRGGAVSGVVRDEKGDPVAGLQVRALRSTFRDGIRAFNADATASTNDLGEYRLFGLTPGPLYLWVFAPAFQLALSVPQEQGGGRVTPTFYPGTTSVSGAKSVTVKLAETVERIDFTTAVVTSASLHGTVIDDQGRPLGRALVTLAQSGFGQITSSAIRAESDGTFSADNLPPGDYEIRLTNTGQTGTQTALTARMSFTLNDAERREIRLSALRPATLTGTLVPRGGTFPSVPTIFRVEALPPPGAMWAQSTVVGALRGDATLKLSGQAPPGRTRIQATNLPRGWLVKSIVANGVDITDSSIDIPEGGTIGLEIEVTNQSTHLVGKVHDANGTSADDYTVVVFARERSHRVGSTRYFATVRPDASTGSFSVEGLPVGEYLAIALEYADPDLVADPDTLAQFEGNAKQIRLTDGETTTVELVLIR